MSNLQDLVKLYIKDNGILKKDFAAQIGISPVKLTHWLHGRVLLSRLILERIIAIINR